MATTWNPSAKSTFTALSNGNLTATYTGATSNAAGALATNAATAGSLKYWEVTVDVVSPSMSAAGAVPGSYDPTNFPAGDFIFYDRGSAVFLNGSIIATYPTYTTGDIIRVALRTDLSPRRIWFSKNGGIWNNNGSADPVSNVGGIDLSAMAVVDLYPFHYMEETLGKVTANFGATAPTYAVPSGFSTFATPVTGTAAPTLALTAAASGTFIPAGYTGTAAVTLRPVSTASGTLGVTGAAAITRGPTSTATGTLGVTGTAAVTRGLTATASGTFTAAGATGSGAVNLVLSPAGVGQHGASGTASATPRLTAAGTGAHGVRAVASGALMPLAAAAGAFTAPVTGSGAVAIVLAASGAGTFTRLGSNIIAHPVFGRTASASPVAGSTATASPVTGRTVIAHPVN